MKHKKMPVERLPAVSESVFGRLSGGFMVLETSQNAALLGGQEANNCQGSNCISGCGTNLEAGCGANTNTVAGCGTKQTVQRMQ